MKLYQVTQTSTLALAALLLAASPAAAKQAAPKPAAAPAEAAPKPWMDKSLSAEARTALLLKEMTQEEKFTLVRGYPGFSFMNMTAPKEAVGSAGYVPGVPRLGISALQETDASLGIANPGKVRPNDFATPLPSSLATAASFNRNGAYEGGAMIGQEAWRQGFNVLLAGGVNLARDPRNGRNFEYLGEDPLLAGTLGGESIRGIQDQHVISTIKHYAVNDQETMRNWANSVIAEGALRESDLLAFELAIEQGKPGSVMCSYNLINGAYGCGNKHLLTDVLKTDWKWPGFVMSDWGAVHDVSYANAGLDQQSAANFDVKPFFGDPLKAELAKGNFTEARLDDMAGRILHAMFQVGVFENPPVRSTIDFKANGDVAQRIAEQGIVLLKNDGGILPMAASAKRIAIIGGYAANGVMSGAGSSQVIPQGNYLSVPVGGAGMAFMNTMVIHPSSPMQAIKALAPNAEVRFDDGRYTASAEKLAKWADVVIVFGVKWTTEAADMPDLTLPDRQDALIDAVATANRKTVVVLETGGPVLMPWLNKVGAVMEAWFPGGRGGEAIANVLFGKVNPSGRLPITFPKDIAQNPRPVIPGIDMPEPPLFFSGPPQVKPFDVVYSEGSDVGYRWFARKGLKPLFPFGYGLSYTKFDYANLKVEGGKTLTVSFDVTNTGPVAGADVPQVYLTATPQGERQRLIGFSRVELKPGQTEHVSVTADPRLLADFDTAAHGWRVKPGLFKVAVSRSAESTAVQGSAAVDEALVKP
jgi:beta-glucosidase